MSLVAIGMDLLLASLLLAALGMGWRLNGRLKALRASQLDFAKAVMELDAAAGRAEAGLAAIKVASEEAHDELLTRIDTARSLAAKLEKAESSADAAARRAEAAAAEVKAAQPIQREPHSARAAHPVRDALARVENGEPEAVRATPRRRPIADEALFADDETPVRPGLQGLMRLSLARRQG